MAELYTRPLAGADDLPTEAEELSLWLLSQFAQNPAWVAPLMDVLSGAITAATRSGIQEALDLLGGPSAAEQLGQVVRDEIADRVALLTGMGRDPSLIHTMVEELVQAMLSAAEDAADVVGGLAASRAPYRATMIAATETVRAANLGRARTFVANGVQRVRWSSVETACAVCAPFVGRVFTLPVDESPPLHPHCRCFWEPVLDSWKPPTTWWTGGGNA